MTHPHHLAGLTLRAAAKQVGIGRNTLCKQLRDAGVFYVNSTLPKPEYIKAGYFVIDTRGFRKGDISKQYTATLVTGAGISWLKQQLDTATAA